MQTEVCSAGHTPIIPPAEPEDPPQDKKSLSNDTNSPDLDELERAEATPKLSSFGSEPLSPRQPVRRTSGRRPLSILSNSSLNSDLSPQSENRTPDMFSPSKHRRHRSVIGASVDYRHHYPPPNLQYYYPGTNIYMANPFQSPSTPSLAGGNPNTAATSGNSATHGTSSNTSHGAPHGPVHSHSYTSSIPLFSDRPYHSPQIGSSSGGEYVSLGALRSPISPPPLASEVPAALSVAAAAAAASNGIQDIFVALAYKERQVLEARQTWEAAKQDLESFRQQLDSMLAPEPEPMLLPIRPTVISRKHTPNLGIHSLQIVPVHQSSPRPASPSPHSRDPTNSHISSTSQGPSVSLWRIDWEVPSPGQPADLDETTEHEDTIVQEPAHAKRGGVALTIVKCLLGIVHCIVTALPIHQRELVHPDRYIAWKPEYPLPMDTLFGHLAN